MTSQIMLSFALGPDLTKSPSLLVREDGTLTGDTGFERVVGFVDRLDSADVEMDVEGFFASPERAVGKYVLLADAHGFLVGNLSSVARVTAVEGQG